jgi:GNAT superfamily N-acetyltransferase
VSGETTTRATIERLPRSLQMRCTLDGRHAPESLTGFGLRTWRDSDRIDVCDLLSQAFRDPSMAVFEDDLAHVFANPGVDMGGVFVVETPVGEVVATATARLDPATPDTGRLHRVAVRPGYHGQGLGHYVVECALNHMRRNGRRFAAVGGMTNALQAVALYLSMEFDPLLPEGETGRVWNAIRSFLGLPCEAPTADPSSAWLDGFFTEDDIIWLVQCTVTESRSVHFGDHVLDFDGLLRNVAEASMYRDRVVALRCRDSGAAAAATDLAGVLGTAGLSFSGAVPSDAPPFYRDVEVPR